MADGEKGKDQNLEEKGKEEGRIKTGQERLKPDLLIITAALFPFPFLNSGGRLAGTKG
jgi:hypothetical protein